MQNTVYLDTAATGIISAETIEAGRTYDEWLSSSPSTAFYSFLEKEFPQLRTNLATFMGIEPERLSLAPNFSYAFSALLTSLKPHRKRVLAFESDYPSLLLPLELQGFTVRKLKSKDGFSWSHGEIESAIVHHNIEILAISHVQYNTGFRADMESISQICFRHNVLLIVDATQSLGAIDFHFDKSGIDVLIASHYKWMNAGFGSAVMCFKSGFIEQFTPAIAGYGSLILENGKMIYEPSASSYFPGHMSLNALLMLHQAVQEKLAMNMQTVDQQNLAMVEMLITGLDSLPIEIIGSYSMVNRSAIVVIKSNEKLHEHLLRNHFRTTYRNETNRISFHHTNNKEDVSSFLTCLRAYSLQSVT